MTVIEKLKDYRKIKAEIRAIELDIEELQDEENIGPASISYEEKTGKTYKFNSHTENLAVSLADKISKLEALKRERERDIKRIENVLEVLDIRQKDILEMKYIKGYKWDTIAFKIDRSYQQCKRVEKQALDKIKNVFTIDAN